MDNTAMKTEPEFRYFLYIAIAFVALLMISNTVAVKLVQFGPFVYAGAILIFPLTYIFGDILTEVYGYKASRKIIWSGVTALIVMSLAYAFVGWLPAASFWGGQESYDSILGFVPRIALASIIALFVGEFCNSYVLSRMKVLMNGRALWMRTIGSTVVGEGVDTLVFGIVAFWGVLNIPDLFALILSGYLFKVTYEIVATPATYILVGFLKRAEGIDMYDRNVNYNPFALADNS